MKSFVSRLIIFLALSLFSLCLISTIVLHAINYQTNDNAIFLWGDSQIFHGVNLQKLRKSTGKKIYSAANGGAGVYDFLVFSEVVPNNSTVIIGVTKLVLIRKRILDRNSSGISLTALIALARNQYSFVEIFDIVDNTKMPTKIFSSFSDLYPTSDSIVYTESLLFLKSVFSTVPEYYVDKENIFLLCLEKLENKNCKIVFLDMPFHPVLNEIKDASLLGVAIDRFRSKILKRYNCLKIDTLILTSQVQKMHDLTHLNINGASEVSGFLSSGFLNGFKGKNKTGNAYVFVKL